MRLLISLLCLVCLVPSAHAADTRVEQSLMCTIAELQGPHDNPERIRMNCGSRHGILKGAHGNLYARQADGGIAISGRVEVESVNEQDSWLRAEAGSSLAGITDAGVVELSVLLPANIYHGLLFDLYVNGIVLLDNYREPLVTLEQVLSATDDGIENQALAAMVVAGHEVVEFTAEMKQQVSHGKWAGKTLTPILEQSTPEDYRAFLRFVRDYPGKYIGKQWKISETYSTWLINDAPLSNADTLDEIVALNGKPGFAERVAGLQESDAATLLAKLCDDINALTPKQYAIGEQKLAVMEHLLAVRVNPSALLRALVENARAHLWMLDRSKYGDAAAAYRRAAEFYAKVPVAQEHNAALDRIICMNNEANAYSRMGQPDEVLKRVAEVRVEVAALRQSPPNDQIAAHALLSEAYAIGLGADIANARGDYRKVVAELLPLLDRYAAVGAAGFRQKEIDLIRRIAKAQQMLGETEAAALLLQRAAIRAQELNNVLKQTEIAWETGELHYGASRFPEALADYQRAAGLAQELHDTAWEAKALAAAGQTYWVMGNPQQALALHEQAMQLRVASGDENGLAWELLQSGKIRVEQGERQQARHDLERALALYTKRDNKSEQAEVHLELGKLFVAMKQPAEAGQHYAEAGALYQSLKMQPDWAWALLGAASVSDQQRDFAGAVKFAEQAAAIADGIGNRELRVVSRTNRATWLHNLGRDKETHPLLDEALAAAGDDGGLRLLALLALSGQQQSEGDLAGADKTIGEALQLSEDSKDVTRRMQVLLARAGILASQGEYDASIQSYEQVVRLAAESGNLPLQAEALQSKGWQLALLGQLTEAKQQAQASLEIARRISDPVLQAWAMNTLAEIAMHLGDVKEELKEYDAAIPLMHQAENHYGEAALIFNRAQVLVRLRDFDEALKRIDEAEKVVGNDSNFDFRLHVAAARGEVLAQLARYEEADQVFQDALRQAASSLPRLVPELLSARGKMLAKHGDYAQALPVLEDAVHVEEKRNRGAFVALSELGIAQSRAHRPEAEATLRLAIERAERAGGAVSWEALYQLGVIEADAGRVGDALKSLERAAREIEKGEVVLQSEVAKTRYWGDKAGIYTLLVRLLLGQDKVGDALRYVERAKAAELEDLRRNAGGREGDLALELEIAESRFDKELRSEQEKAHPDAAKMQHLDELLADVRRRRAEYIDKLDREMAQGGGNGRDVYSIRPLELEKLQQYIPAETLVLSPMALDEKLVVFAITHDAITHFEVAVNNSELDRLVRSMLDGVSTAAAARRGTEMAAQRGAVRKAAPGAAVTASGDALREASVRLYDLLIRPAFQRFGAPKVLVVSASGGLRYLPFAALHDGKSWLMEQTALIEVTALDQQKFASEPAAGKASVLALVDPDGSLPGARREVNEVKGVVSKMRILGGTDATLAAFRSEIRAPGYDIVHLATHGRLDGEHPEQSHILLSGQSLYYKDIPGLRFARTRLVVLSACDTAARGSGVEITGLAYQFERTNVRSVVATLWPVDDAATARLMGEFYRNLDHGMGYVVALATAQRALAADSRYRHPYYWAPFVLIGAP
ncbi:MAG: CHAT domain-containing protein [Gallionella sp.]|nr:CHAT domain-containing protein [Gallionella sp.]MDD4946991.1 CHAT domain-containing protein [Gallionella sp.]